MSVNGKSVVYLHTARQQVDYYMIRNKTIYCPLFHSTHEISVVLDVIHPAYLHKENALRILYGHNRPDGV